MPHNDWTQVKEILDAAVRRRPEERAKYLDQACDGNADVRREVESLLSSFEKADDFLERPAVDPAAENLTLELGSRAAGQMIGRYEIIRKLGEGGMGAVYLARDTTLRRNVAIKMLSANVAGDADRLRRLEQEAVAASALNHPNILTIHEIGESDGARFIVSEYVDGCTLREKIGELTAVESIEIVTQAASALEAAHKQGIIHRDIKPENIMVRDDGLVKLLDFGLSKLTGQRDKKAESEAETLALVKTEPGIIMGTASYMSPEQARGQNVDNRSDIWSLGAVFYEMLSGRTPFGGETTMDVIASVLHKEPAPLPAEVSSDIAAVILHTLEKKKEQRYETAGDLLSALRSLKAEPGLQPYVDRSGFERQNKETASLARPTTKAIRPPASKWIIAAVSVVALALISGVLIYRNYGTWTNSGSVNSANKTNRSPAYDLYVRGKVKSMSYDRDDIEEAIKVLEQAVSIDPNYAEAYAILAEAYTNKAFYYTAAPAEAKQLTENAEVALEKALALNPNLADAYVARGIVLWTHTKRFPHEQAIKSYQIAIEIDPNNPEAHHWLAVVYAHVGLVDDAQREVQIALKLNPNNSLLRNRVASYDALQGKFEESLEVLKTIPADVSPALINSTIANALHHLNRDAEAELVIDNYLKTYPNDEGGNLTSVKAILLTKAGRYKEAQTAIDRAIAIGQGYGHFHHTAYNIAAAYAIMNKQDEAMKWLQNAADDGFPCYPFFEIDHSLDNLRKDPRFIEFMSKRKIQMENFRQLAQGS